MPEGGQRRDPARGSEAIHSNTAIAQALAGALNANGVPAAAVTVLTDLRREAMLELLQLHELIDLAIPRGGEGLIRFVASMRGCR